jgi:hypothetical protein
MKLASLLVQLKMAFSRGGLKACLVQAQSWQLAFSVSVLLEPFCASR